MEASEIQGPLDFIIRETRARKSSDGWIGHCPAHKDKKASLSIGVGNDGAILLKCFAGCETENVVQKLGLSMSDLFPKDRPIEDASNRQCDKPSQENHGPKRDRPITVATLAEDKKLPVEFLKTLGIQNYRKGVEIPYFREDGSPAPRKRLRTALKAKDGSYWTKGKEELVPYGLDRLSRAQELKYQIVVEGESDCWTAWFYEYPALGIPGSSMVKTLQLHHLKDIDYLCVVNEGDEGGAHFTESIVARLKALKWAGKAYEISLRETFGVKDVNELHKKYPNDFKSKFQSALNNSIKGPPIYLYPEVESPLPLYRKLDLSSRYPVEALGPILGPAARVIQESTQAPMAICANSILAAAALAVQPHANVEMDGRVFPISEYFLTVAESGERKSTVDQFALMEHREYEKTKMRKYREEKTEWEQESDIYRRTRDEILNQKNKRASDKREALAALEAPAYKPRLPLLLIQEPTYEGIIKMYLAGSPSLGLFSDEGGRFLGGHTMSKDNQVKTAAGLSEFWDGTSTTRVRSAEDASAIYDRRLSVHLMVQPIIAQRLFLNEILSGQGIITRFLPVFPETACGNRFYKNLNPCESEELCTYYERVKEILEIEMPVAEGAEADLKPRSLTLNNDAKKIWIEFYNDVEAQLGPDGRFSPIRGTAAKSPQHAARIAGILAVFHRPSCNEIHANEIEWGVVLTKHYLGEALRLYHNGTVDEDLKLAEDLLAWLQKRENNVVSLVEVYRYGPNAVRTAKAASKVVEVLEKHGWLVPVPDGVEFEGRHRKKAWRLVGSPLEEFCLEGNT